MTRRIPNLFVIGAMKCGTTTLHNHLHQHPQIFMCEETKEPGFFVEELNWNEGFDWYYSLFAGAGDEPIVGESSTHYTMLPVYRGVVEKIARFNPDARFIYMMRDPVERLVSHYWHNVRDLVRVPERRDMLTAVQRDPQYIGFSDYAMQLAPYFQTFGRERVYTLTFESMVADPRAAVGKVLAWLGVGDNNVPLASQEVWNAMPEGAERVRGLGLLNRLRHTPLWFHLSPLVPKKLRELGGRMAVAPVDKSSQPVDDVVKFARPILQERTEALRELLHRDFPEWRTLGSESVLSAGGRL